MKCLACDGCGKVADTVDREPWTAWLNLPLKSSLAVIDGMVAPITCPGCEGTGEYLTCSEISVPCADTREMLAEREARNDDGKRCSTLARDSSQCLLVEGHAEAHEYADDPNNLGEWEEK
jgi:hypothetical protein